MRVWTCAHIQHGCDVALQQGQPPLPPADKHCVTRLPHLPRVQCEHILPHQRLRPRARAQHGRYTGAERPPAQAAAHARWPSLQHARRDPMHVS
jgi:hypothetical protein